MSNEKTLVLPNTLLSEIISIVLFADPTLGIKYMRKYNSSNRPAPGPRSRYASASRIFLIYNQTHLKIMTNTLKISQSRITNFKLLCTPLN